MRYYLSDDKEMNYMNQLGIILQTTLGNYYVYNTATNQIITIDKDWYHSVSDAQNDEKVFEALAENGVLVDDIPDVINWPINPEDYRRVVNEAIPSLILEVTQECTLRCEYCVYSGNYENMRTHSKRRMDHEMIKRCLDYYYEHSKLLDTANISFYGGEALICFDEVKYAVEYTRKLFKDKAINFRLSSNGTTLTEDVIEWLEANEDVSVTVTVNGLSHDQYRRFPSGNGSLEIIEKNLSKIRNDYPALWDRIDLIANVASLQELLDLREYYIDHVGKPPLLITGILQYGGNDIIRRIIEIKDPDYVIEEVRRLFFDEADSYILTYYRTYIVDIVTRAIGQRDRKVFESASCMPFTSSLFVSATGEFGVCERAGVCPQLGNIYEGVNLDFATRILNNASAILNNRCRKCWCQRLCTMCLKDFQISEDGEIVLPEYICSDIRENIKSTLIMFCELVERNSDVLLQIQKDINKTE